MTLGEPGKSIPPVDMSPEAIAARLRRVVELNRLCRSLAGAAPAPAQPEESPGADKPVTSSVR